MKLRMALLLAIVGVFLTVRVATACSPVLPDVSLSCRTGGVLHIPWDTAAAVLPTLTSACGPRIVDPGLVTAIERWHRTLKGPFESGSLRIMQYSAAADKRVQTDNPGLLGCWYAETQRVGDWLLVRNASREYCHLRPALRCCQCPELRVSAFELIRYAVVHPGQRTLPLLGTLMVGAAILARAGWVLAQRGQLGALLRPRPRALAATLGLWLACLGLFAAGPGDVVGWFGVAYAVSSVATFPWRSL